VVFANEHSPPLTPTLCPVSADGRMQLSLVLFNSTPGMVNYYVQADLPAKKLTAPLETPLHTYTVTRV